MKIELVFPEDWWEAACVAVGDDGSYYDPVENMRLTHGSDLPYASTEAEVEMEVVPQIGARFWFDDEYFRVEEVVFKIGSPILEDPDEELFRVDPIPRVYLSLCDRKDQPELKFRRGEMPD